MTTQLWRMQQRRRDTATWTSENGVLLQGELGVETDTGKWKIGDGSTAWTALPYQPSNAGVTAAITAAINAAIVAADAAGAATAAQAYAIQRSNHTGVQPASTVSLPPGVPAGATAVYQVTTSDGVTLYDSNGTVL